MKPCSSAPRAGGVCALAKFLFFGLALSGVLAWPVTSARATPRIWLGNTSLWSNPDHWSPSGVPQNGDALTFPDISPFGVVSMNNNLASLSLDNITGWPLRFDQPYRPEQRILPPQAITL